MDTNLIEELVGFVREIATGYDCDEDAHKYKTRCRCCEADKLWEQTKKTVPTTGPELVPIEWRIEGTGITVSKSDKGYQLFKWGGAEQGYYTCKNRLQYDGGTKLQWRPVENDWSFNPVIFETLQQILEAYPHVE